LTLRESGRITCRPESRCIYHAAWRTGVKPSVAVTSRQMDHLNSQIIGQRWLTAVPRRRAGPQTAAAAPHLAGGGRAAQAPLRDALQHFPVNFDVPPRDDLGVKTVPRALPGLPRHFRGGRRIDQHLLDSHRHSPSLAAPRNRSSNLCLPAKPSSARIKAFWFFSGQTRATHKKVFHVLHYIEGENKIVAFS
jgi:hypothetical protein